MEDAESTLSVTVVWRRNKYIVKMNSDASLKDLGDELQKLTDVKADTMRLIVPQFSNRSPKLLSPFSDQHSHISLQEASIIEGKSIRMMGVSEDEVDKVLQGAQDDTRIAGFDEEEKRMRQRLSDRPHALTKLPQGPYIFCDFHTLQIPGLELNPPASEALKRMHMLAADPGIVAIMNKHRWRVGIMTELAPVGYVGVSPKCILGFNKNHGEEISLRLRTDDLKGFRKCESIKKTLLHELAHMVHSEHDANFYALDKQLNQEAVSLDWTKSKGHSLSKVRHPDHYEEDFYVADNRSSSQKLGGNVSGQLASARASSVAAAYRRLADASAQNSGIPDVHEEPDPDDSGYGMQDIPDILDVGILHKTQKEEHDPDPDEHLCDQNNFEPDPDDSLGNQVINIMKNGIQPNKNIDEPDLDDLEVGDGNIERHDHNISQATKSMEDQAHLNKAHQEPHPDESQQNRVLQAEPDPDDHLVPAREISGMQIDEPDPDDSQANQVIVIMKNGIQPNKTIDEPDPDDLEAKNNLVDGNIERHDHNNSLVTKSKEDQANLNKTHQEPDPDESQQNRIVQAEPDPDDSLVPAQEISNMQVDEPDPDDQELRRIQDPVTVFCGRLQKAVETLRTENPMEATTALQALFKIIKNLIEHPNELKFKRLRKANHIIQKNVVNHKAAMEILHMVGFCEDIVFNEIGRPEAYLVLKRNDPGLLWLAKSSLESCVTC